MVTNYVATRYVIIIMNAQRYPKSVDMHSTAKSSPSQRRFLSLCTDIVSMTIHTLC